MPRSLSILIAGCAAIMLASLSLGETQETFDKTVSRIPHKPVASTAIAAVGYSKRLHTLEIEFQNGAIYRYFDVSPSIHRELMAAESKTRYYHQNIKGNYRFAKIRSGRKEKAAN